MAFDIPPGRILPVSGIDVRLVAGAHPFERDNRAAIDENWQSEVAKKPALFDGEVVLLSDLSWRDGHLAGRCHVVRYATFLYWRRNRAESAAGHVFAHAVLVSGDGALVAIRMAAHTVNAGKVYFAAGSFEPVDFPDGRVDIDFNMAREVREETGLDIAAAAREAECYLFCNNTGTVLFRRYRLAETAARIARRVSDHVAAEAEPEIDGPVLIRGPGDLPQGVMPHTQAIVRWHFADP